MRPLAAVTMKPVIALTFGAITLSMALSTAGRLDAATKISVPTSHYDAFRSGWDAGESVLDPATVGSANFNLRKSVEVDDQVDAQPLYVANERITAGSHRGVHDVVYVATASDTIYAIDANDGTVLNARHFGSPVPSTALPGGCGNNGPNVGISSTPTIDLTTATMYAMTYTYENSKPVYRLHALSLADLSDVKTPVTVAAMHRLKNGRSYAFAPEVSRQRSALLDANGTIYAAFASFCDLAADRSRGWLLGWSKASLAPLAANQLNNQLGHTPHDFFLGSIWMSGSGPAVDGGGYVYFVTSNSEPNSYDGVNAIQESVVKMAPDLSSILSIFTPGDAAALDAADREIGSGGVTIVPMLPGKTPYVAVTAGKDGRMFVLDRERLGGFNPGGPDNDLEAVSIGKCFCSESYYTGPDGVGRIVTSGGSQGSILRVKTAPHVSLETDTDLQPISTGQDSGFMTTVSSNGTTAGSQIVWAVSRPVDKNPANVNLIAFDAGNGSIIFSQPAGTWPNVSGNANIVPVVANGKVFVASYRQVSIFGLSDTSETTAASVVLPRPEYRRPRAIALANGVHEFSGTIVRIDNDGIIVRTRAGRMLRVDTRTAWRKHLSTVPVLGRAVLVRASGTFLGPFVAQSVVRAKDSPALWQNDR